jgi:hypothetical protein
MKSNIDPVVTMANLIYCTYYTFIQRDKLIDDILAISKFTLMMEDISGIIIYNPETNNFYFKSNEPTNNNPN